MRTCPNCHCQLDDDALYCPVCGTAVNAYIPPRPTHTEPKTEETTPIPTVDPYDHTDEYLEEDINGTKLICMLVYLLDFFGVIIGLLAARESEYTAFHIRQSMKFTVLEVLIGLVTGLLCWTVIVPVIAAVAIIVLLVIKFVCFTQVCSGLAREPVLIRSISFLK